MKSTICKLINLINYLLAYFNLKKRRFDIKKKINFGCNKSNIFFQSRLLESKSYLEFGSGSSTFLARNMKKKFLSIECDKSFFKEIIKSISSKNLLYIDIGPTKYDSIPILPKFFLKKKIENYLNVFEKFKKKFSTYPELILVDGRFRVLVCLKALSVMIKNKENIKILLDDYKNREYYQILNKYFSISCYGRMGYLKRKKNINLIKVQKDINKFYYDYK